MDLFRRILSDPTKSHLDELEDEPDLNVLIGVDSATFEEKRGEYADPRYFDAIEKVVHHLFEKLRLHVPIDDESADLIQKCLNLNALATLVALAPYVDDCFDTFMEERCVAKNLKIFAAETGWDSFAERCSVIHFVLKRICASQSNQRLSRWQIRLRGDYDYICTQKEFRWERTRREESSLAYGPLRIVEDELKTRVVPRNIERAMRRLPQLRQRSHSVMHSDMCQYVTRMDLLDERDPLKEQRKERLAAMFGSEDET